MLLPRRLHVPVRAFYPSQGGLHFFFVGCRQPPLRALSGVFAAHGFNRRINTHGFDRGIVYLHMKGACAGCPSSTLTLKMGIENLLRHYIPEVTEVRPVAL